MNVKSSDAIAAIKAKIELTTSIPPNAQILVYLGRKLEDRDTLHYYNIRENGCVHLIESMYIYICVYVCVYVCKYICMYEKPNLCMQSTIPIELGGLLPFLSELQ